MDWLKDLFIEHSALQAVVVISLISTIGIGLGKIRFFGISLGTAFIFFVGILAGHLGLTLDPAMLTYAESFGLIIFVYALGLQVGPGFFSSLRAGGLRLVSPAIAVVAVGTLQEVGNDYITLFHPGRSAYITADIYSIRFVEFPQGNNVITLN